MEIREDINILADDGNLIKFEEVTVKTDELTREEVARLEQAIAVLEQENEGHNQAIIANNAKIDEIKAQLNHCKEIIAKADELKAQEQAQEQVEGQM